MLRRLVSRRKTSGVSLQKSPPRKQRRWSANNLTQRERLFRTSQARPEQRRPTSDSHRQCISDSAAWHGRFRAQHPERGPAAYGIDCRWCRRKTRTQTKTASFETRKVLVD